MTVIAQPEMKRPTRRRGPANSSTGCGCCRAARTAGHSFFEEVGFAALTPFSPDDPERGGEAPVNPRGPAAPGPTPTSRPL
jgi:hypothetical protein